MTGAYILTLVKTGVFYIGSSGNIDKRLTRHRWELKAGRHVNKKLQAAHDADQDYFVQAFETPDREKAYDLEEVLIDQHKDNPLLCNHLDRFVRGGVSNLFNPNFMENLKKGWGLGGRKAGFTLSEETKRKIALIKTGLKASEETREKMSRFQKGRTRDPRVIQLATEASRKKVKVGDTLYESCTAAALAHSITVTNVKYRINNTRSKWVDWNWG